MEKLKGNYMGRNLRENIKNQILVGQSNSVNILLGIWNSSYGNLEFTFHNVPDYKQYFM